MWFAISSSCDIFTHLNLMEFQVRYLTFFRLFSVIDGVKCFWMGSLHKNIQLILVFLKVPTLVLHFSCYTLTFKTFITFFLFSICNTAIYAGDTTQYSKCDQASDLWQHLEFASEFEHDL